MNRRNKTYYKHTKNTPMAIQNNAISILAKILDSQIDYSRKDVARWRQAIVNTSNFVYPTNVLLQDIYTDVSMDGHLQANILIRKSSVLNTEFNIYTPQGEINQDWKNFINKKWMFDLINDILDSIFTGTLLIELSQVNDKEVIYNKIPPRNVIAKQKKVLLNPFDASQGISYDNPIYQKSIIQIGDSNNIGILNNIVPQLIWKRHAQQSWAEFSEKFGIPMVTALSNSKDKAQLALLDQKLKDLGEAATAVLPFGTTIDIKQPTNTDAYNVFLTRIELCNAEISKQIVGGTMISDNGSSKAQSEVHERTLDEKIALSDMRSIEFVINDQLLPLLRQYYNINIPPDQYFAFDKSNQIDPIKLFPIVQTLLTTHDIDDEWIKKTFNIPVKKKVTTNNNPLNTPPISPKTDNAPPLKSQIWDNKDNEKGKYPPSNSNILDNNPTCCTPFIAINNVPNSIKSIIDNIINSINKGNNTDAKTALLTIETANTITQSFNKAWNINQNIAYNTPDYIAYQAMQLNIFRFSAAKSIAQVQAYNNALLKPDGTKRTFEEFKQEAQKINSTYNAAYLNTEYNHAIAVGQSVSSYYSAIANKEKVPFVQFHTMSDARVRNEHQALNGKIFNLNDKSIGIIYPPLAYNCRCEIIPYALATKETSTPQEAINLLGNKLSPEFSINRADAQEVFTQNQMYVSQVSQKTQDVIIEKLNQLSFKDYGLSDTILSNTSLNLNSNITIDEVKKQFNNLKDKNNNMLYEDFMKRKIILTENNFIEHITGKYILENRHLYFNKIKEVLNEPTEVWMKYYDKSPSLRYIKYYNDGTSIIVQGGFNNKTQTFEIGSWFKNNRDNENRVGFILKKNEK